MAKLAKFLQSAAGNAGGEPGLDIDEVFSTYLYAGNGSTQKITNGISLGDGAGDGVYYQSSTTSVTLNLSPVSNITVTNTGGTSLDTSLAKFSTCYQFDGNADFLTLSQPVFDSATPFCFETWVRFNSVGSASDMGMIANQYTGGEAGRMLFGGQSDRIVVRINGGAVYLTTGSSSVSTGTWYHVAWTYDGTTHRLYLDGTLKDSNTTMPSIYTGTNTEIAGIDTARLSNYDLWGRLEDIRVTLGKARYTGSSYTVPTAKFPQDTLVQGEGGLVWIKSRTESTYGGHALFDTERGATNPNNVLSTSGDSGVSATAAQYTSSPSTSDLTSFNANGFSLGPDNYFTKNTNGEDYASWTFRKAPKFFTCLTYTGTGPGSGANEQQVSHDLGAKPGIVIIKRTDATGDWWVFTDVIDGSNDYAYLNQTAAFGNSANNVATDSVFNVGGVLNTSGATYVAYLFAHNDGDGGFGPDGSQDIIKCGSYTGNGANQDIDIGFEPQWILVKSTTFAHDWYIYDTMRGFKTYSGTDTNNLDLKPNESNAESDFDGISLKSNGIGLHGASNAANNNGQTYIYMAIRRGPLAVPEDATEVFDVYTGSDAYPSVITTGFTVDSLLGALRSGNSNNFISGSRLTGSKSLTTSSAAAQIDGLFNDPTNACFMRNDGILPSTFGQSNTVYYSWRRAPGYFDVVAYSGTGTSNQTLNHNLGVAPEMMWVKRRNGGSSWLVYHKGLDVNGDSAPETDVLDLSTTDAAFDYSSGWFDTAPTDTQFTVGAYNNVTNNGNTYIAYLFASAPGVSKVGSFTHTSGSNTDVDCGFTAGARFVLIKRTDNVGHWLVFDTERGIVAGNDSWLNLNLTDAENTSYDFIDPLSSGFTVDGSGLLATGSYIFYAIA